MHTATKENAIHAVQNDGMLERVGARNGCLYGRLLIPFMLLGAVVSCGPPTTGPGINATSMVAADAVMLRRAFVGRGSCNPAGATACSFDAALQFTGPVYCTVTPSTDVGIPIAASYKALKGGLRIFLRSPQIVSTGITADIICVSE
jgi:hypothetical protein